MNKNIIPLLGLLILILLIGLGIWYSQTQKNTASVSNSSFNKNSTLNTTNQKIKEITFKTYLSLEEIKNLDWNNLPENIGPHQELISPDNQKKVTSVGKVDEKTGIPEGFLVYQDQKRGIKREIHGAIDLKDFYQQLYSDIPFAQGNYDDLSPYFFSEDGKWFYFLAQARGTGGDETSPRNFFRFNTESYQIELVK